MNGIQNDYEMCLGFLLNKKNGPHWKISITNFSFISFIISEMIFRERSENKKTYYFWQF